MTDHELSEAIRAKAAGEGTFAIAWAIIRLAEAQRATATSLALLGKGDAATPMGALEMLAGEVKAGSAAIANALGEIADNLPPAD